MKKKKKEASKKYWYIQDWGTYSNETPIFVGYSVDEITKIMRRAKLKKEAVEAWEKSTMESKIARGSQNGTLWYDAEKGWSLIYFPDFADDWYHLETLMHECFHAVIHILGKNRAFINGDQIEDEGLAYQHEYLFRSIRRKLQARFPNK